MNWKLIAAVIVGLITGVLLYFWTESVKNEQVAYAFMRLQPDRKVTRGQAITPDMLAEPVMLPESFGALAKLAVPAASAYQEWLKDRTAASDIPAGSVLLFQYFDDTDGGRLTTMIAPGKRALTLPVNAAAAVGHFVEPGSYVDILGTVDEPVEPVAPAAATQPGTPGQAPAVPGQQPAATGQPPAPAQPPSPVEQMLKNYLTQYPGADENDVNAYRKQAQDYKLGISSRTRVVTRTFLQNVKVLAVGAATTPEGAVTKANSTYNNVTVEVTPSEAEMLIFAMGQSNGSLNLVLRNPTDNTVEDLPSINWTRM
ncbi:pilus assembly protein CpaB [Rhizobium anhuiense]|jgi:Flp pilus assembly protein CpaB|uniref:Pilus assembly protein CpaB n=1 Tax=Rhizobium anhuiense TaxID=1184720 RepID=A0ABX4JDJ2_9HYPH|nr:MULTISPECIES: RcpC/CpaB family pilus assembly protein [Rhizobium]KZS50217.1 pilus assembly protein CpaB [Rhizobium anhuiense bv. trifolii]MBB3742646.1 Flp pilus assembly protein CpaB [Rhizobium sp. BK591]MBB4117638.1 Flp pilus assembly protein CpaB [Rhizobium sp. BK226]MBB4252278.1 Flp pilus assembly protein CpaB [Rhizobium sp. BK008]PDS45830.1 pilus assembly protein CpaB [Rhizobium anhuiense]